MLLINFKTILIGGLEPNLVNKVFTDLYNWAMASCQSREKNLRLEFIAGQTIV